MSDLLQRRPHLLPGLLSLTAFLVITVLVAHETSWVLALDETLGRGPQRFTADHPRFADGWIILGHATDTWPAVGASVVAVVVLAIKGYRRPAGLVAVTMLLVAGLIPAVKHLVRRERPHWPDPITQLASYSFPSGHTVNIVAATGLVLILSTMLVRRRTVRRLIAVGVIALAVLVAVDRIMLGVHHVSDVVGGAFLGAAIALLTRTFFDPTPRSLAERAEPLPATVPTGRRLAAVLNPTKVDNPTAFKAMVEELATAAGWESIAWWPTTIEDTGRGMAHEAAVSGADLVLAIGGDGTIRAVCEELAGTGIPIGIVPAGTGNLLARNLQIPLYLRSAIDVALHGQDFAIDLVEVSGDNMDDATFLVMAGMGFDAAIMEGVNERFKQRVGWLAYVWAGLKALMFPAIRIEVSIDGGDFTRHRARTVVIGNVGYLQAGMPLIPDATIDDGNLDVVLLNPRRFLSWLPLAARVLTKNKRTDEALTRMRGRTVTVRSATNAPRQLDGDLINPGKTLHATCIHGRVLVRIQR